MLKITAAWRLLIHATIICALAIGTVPAAGVVIEPGEYKLEWKVPAPHEDIFRASAGVPVDQASTEVIKSLGLASENCCEVLIDRFTMFVDESKGTGSGYDTAYLFPIELSYEEMNLQDAVRILLIKKDDLLLSDPEKPCSIDIEIGPPENKQKKQVIIELRIEPPSDSDIDSRRGYAFLTLRGGWYGIVKSDAGDLQVMLIDSNANGLYNDCVFDSIYEDNAGPLVIDGDAIVLAPQNTSNYRQAQMIYLSDVISYGSRLYEVDVTPSGDNINIKPYSGEVGWLNISAVDGKNQPAHWREIGIEGSNARFSFTPEDGSKVPLPPGEYTRVFAFIEPNADMEDDSFGIFVAAMRSFTIKAGETVNFSLGGPLKVDILGSDIILASKGETQLLKFRLTVGGDEVWGFSGDRKLVVNIRDSKENLKSNGMLDFSDIGAYVSNNVYGYRLQIPIDWKTGSYKVCISLNMEPYQPEIFKRKAMEIRVVD